MTHRPPNGLLVFMPGQICLSFHVVVGAYVLAVYRQVVCWPYCALQPCRTDVRQVLLVNSSCIRNTGQGYGSGSRLDMFSRQQRERHAASSLRRIRCVWALSRYTPSPDLLNKRSSTALLASITIITVQLLTDAGLLQVHVFTVNVVAPYTDIYTKKWCQISSASLPETHPCAQTILYRFWWQFQFRQIGLSARLIVGDLVCRQVGCRRIGLSVSWFFGELNCRRVGCRRVVQLPYYLAAFPGTNSLYYHIY